MFDFKNIGKLMDQAKKLQEQLKERQAALAKQTVVGKAGGGSISIEATCQYQALHIHLEPSFHQEDLVVQQDLIKAAFNDTTRRIEEVISGTMSDLASQMPSQDMNQLEDKE